MTDTKPLFVYDPFILGSDPHEDFQKLWPDKKTAKAVEQWKEAIFGKMWPGKGNELWNEYLDEQVKQILAKNGIVK